MSDSALLNDFAAVRETCPYDADDETDCAAYSPTPIVDGVNFHATGPSSPKHCRAIVWAGMRDIRHVCRYVHSCVIISIRRMFVYLIMIEGGPWMTLFMKWLC